MGPAQHRGLAPSQCSGLDRGAFTAWRRNSRMRREGEASGAARRVDGTRMIRERHAGGDRRRGRKEAPTAGRYSDRTRAGRTGPRGLLPATPRTPPARCKSCRSAARRKMSSRAAASLDTPSRCRGAPSSCRDLLRSCIGSGSKSSSHPLVVPAVVRGHGSLGLSLTQINPACSVRRGRGVHRDVHQRLILGRDGRSLAPSVRRRVKSA